MKKVKKLLEESTIRQFMKYADIEPLAETFLDTVEEEEFYEEDDMEMGDDEPEMDMDMEPEMDMDMDAPEGDMDMDMGDDEPGMRDMMENEDEDLMEARVNRIAARVAQRLMAENKKASNIDALTERIFNRLAGK